MGNTYKTYQALLDTVEIVENLLKDAGLLDGLSLTPESIKTAKKPIFWYLNTKSKEASSKETYVTYSVQGLDPHDWGDGRIISRSPSVNINIFTRIRKSDNLIKDLNDVFVNNGWTFELQNSDYDGGLHFYIYTFNCRVVLMDG